MSRFLQQSADYDADSGREIDFDRATKLPGGGSTCDIFRSRWQRRDVFVKRLKEEFRSGPLYLDALDKEFDIGVGLNHPSLPQYREFHRDYIVMDYIDGATLAEMIRRKDSWLSDVNHLDSLLRELVGAVDYLHRHNVVHCDIKPDNVMITANGHNLVLIDFDKCYSDALGDTPGDPGKYGLTPDMAGNVAIDFLGIAQVAKALLPFAPRTHKGRLNRFIRTCDAPNADCERLLSILSHKSRKSLAAIAIVSTSILCLLLMWGYYLYHTKTVLNEAAQRLNDSERTASTINGDAPADAASAAEPAMRAPSAQAPAAYEVDKADEEIKKKSARLDKQIAIPYGDLNERLDNLGKLKNDTSVSAPRMLEAIRDHAKREDECLRETFSIMRMMYPGLTEKDYWDILASSKIYSTYMRRAAAEEATYRREYERRKKTEGNASH